MKPAILFVFLFWVKCYCVIFFWGENLFTVGSENVFKGSLRTVNISDHPGINYRLFEKQGSASCPLIDDLVYHCMLLLYQQIVVPWKTTRILSDLWPFWVILVLWKTLHIAPWYLSSFKDDLRHKMNLDLLKTIITTHCYQSRLYSTVHLSHLYSSWNK